VSRIDTPAEQSARHKSTWLRLAQIERMCRRWARRSFRRAVREGDSEAAAYFARKTDAYSRDMSRHEQLAKEAAQ
jgi:hypothetical protein